MSSNWSVPAQAAVTSLGLGAFLALGDAEAHLLALGEGAVTRAADRAEMHEHVRGRWHG
jgi:hypothetical protein